ncbi:MAG TPA: hypothetical protein VF463_19170 [Sphingobium sp.]
MTPDEEGFTAEDLIDAQCPLDISTMNGIVLLATAMRTHGLLTNAQLETLHAEMSNPLGTPDLAENAVVQTAQSHLDRLFAAIATL